MISSKMISSRSMLSSQLSRRAQAGFSVGNIRSFMSPAVKRYRKLQKVKTQPNLARNVQEMDNNTLVTVASMSNHEATIEVLKRHIMMVDKVPYEEAEKTFDKIQKVNNQRKWLAALPYQFGIVTATGTAMASIPMVFGLNTATWFNHNFVTIEVPDAADLETALEVGSWSWSWMVRKMR